jgi:hypothetical protein
MMSLVIQPMTASSALPLSVTKTSWVSVAITLNLTSTRGMASAEIARQLGVTEGALTRSNAKFMKLTGWVPAPLRERLWSTRTPGAKQAGR